MIQRLLSWLLCRDGHQWEPTIYHGMKHEGEWVAGPKKSFRCERCGALKSEEVSPEVFGDPPRTEQTNMTQYNDP